MADPSVFDLEFAKESIGNFSHINAANVKTFFSEMPLPWTLTASQGDTFVEAWWRYMLANFTDFQLIVYGTMIISLFGYFVIALPYSSLVFFKSLEKYKIQPEEAKYWSFRDLVNASMYISANLIFMIFPIIWVSFPFFKSIGIVTDIEAIPTWYVALGQFIFFFMLEDFCHYWLHRGMHENKWFYNNIHVIHHEWTAPIAVASEYAHPAEVLILGFGTFLGPALLSPHVLVLWAWIFMRQNEALCVHSGYDFPWAPYNIVPFFSGPPHHDHHHHYYTGNFSSTFTYLDWFYGTDTKYEELKAKKQN